MLKLLIVKTFVRSVQLRGYQEPWRPAPGSRKLVLFRANFFGNIFEATGKRIIQFSLNEVGNSVVHKETGRDP